MATTLFALLLLVAYSSNALAYRGATDDLEVIDRDVCVIGGGASGTYAAVRLQQMGKTVALVEKQSQLGGHVDTYTDPATGQTVDYGVQVFSNISVTKNFFDHFQVPLVEKPAEAGPSLDAIFHSGLAIPGDIYSDPALGPAVLGYINQLNLYPGIAASNTWDIPSPVPEDLLLPFGDFLAKHDITALAPVAFAYNQGIGNILAQPTLYVMRYFDSQIVNDLITNRFVVNGLQNNQLLYDRAQTELGPNVFLNSNVTQVLRSNDTVQVEFSYSGRTVLVRASKLLIAIEPKASSLNFLDLTANENAIFSQFNNSYYWDAVVRNIGIPSNTTVTNNDPTAALGVPALPALYLLTGTSINETHLAYFCSPDPMSDEDVKAEILGTLGLLQQTLGFLLSGTGPEIVAFNDHSPFELTVSTDAIMNGFYNDLQALQGTKNTWWTGAAWNKHATSQLWNFTEYEILPGLLV